MYYAEEDNSFCHVCPFVRSFRSPIVNIDGKVLTVSFYKLYIIKIYDGFSLSLAFKCIMVQRFIPFVHAHMSLTLRSMLLPLNGCSFCLVCKNIEVNIYHTGAPNLTLSLVKDTDRTFKNSAIKTAQN